MKRNRIAVLVCLLVLVLVSLACGSASSPPVQQAIPTQARPVPTFAPTAVPVSSSLASELVYLEVTMEYTGGCADAMDWFAQVMDSFENTDSWQNMALDANDNADYMCASLGGYSNVPPAFAGVQRDIDSARADFGEAFGYARYGITYLDSPSLEKAITYIDRGTQHISDGTAKISAMK